MIGFKVVRDGPCCLESAVRNQLYAMCGRTKRQPGYGPLAVFRALKDAQQFIYWWGTSSHRIFICKYKRSRARSLWDGCSRERVMLHELPCGTDMADWIELGTEYPARG